MLVLSCTFPNAGSFCCVDPQPTVSCVSAESYSHDCCVLGILRARKRSSERMAIALMSRTDAVHLVVSLGPAVFADIISHTLKQAAEVEEESCHGGTTLQYVNQEAQNPSSLRRLGC